MYFNQITIVGYATRDAENKDTKSEKVISKFAVGVSRGKDQPTDFFEVTCFEKPWVAEAVTKGSLVMVQGSMRSNKGNDAKTYWGITADKVMVLNKKESKNEEISDATGKSGKKSGKNKKFEDNIYYG